MLAELTIFCYIFWDIIAARYTVSPAGVLAGVKVSFGELVATCGAFAAAVELGPGGHFALLNSPVNGSCFLAWAFVPLATGSTCTFLPIATASAPAVFATIGAKQITTVIAAAGTLASLISSVAAVCEARELVCVSRFVLVSHDRPHAAFLSR